MKKKIPNYKKLFEAEKAQSERFRVQYLDKSHALSDLEEAVKKENHRKEMDIREGLNRSIDFNKTLLEIIRWQVCPETTKFPFQVEKGQVRNDPGRSNFGSLSY